MVRFEGIPLPPSENQLYRNVPKIGRVKSSVFRAYEKDFEAYCLKYAKRLQEAGALCEGKPFLRLELTFRFLEAQLFCKNGQVKKMDVTNRLKCVIDLLCKKLGFDDSAFFEVFCEKTLSTAPGVDIQILELQRTQI